MIAATRRYRFPAAHVLARADFSAEQNRRVYGKCANPSGHGHDYAVEVTIAGELDADTSRLLAPERFDGIVSELVLQRFSHRMLNDDPLFAEQVPTAENLARAAYALLREPLAAAGVALRRVRVRETRNNTFDYGELR